MINHIRFVFVQLRFSDDVKAWQERESYIWAAGGCVSDWYYIMSVTVICDLKTEQTHGIEKSISLDTRNRKAKENKITNQFLTAGMLDRTISTLLSISKVVRLQSFCTLLTYSWLTSFDSRFMISWRTKQSLAKGTLERIQRHAPRCDDVIILPWGIKTNALSKSSNSHSKCILESTRFNGLFWKFRFQKTINLDKSRLCVVMKLRLRFLVYPAVI